MILGLCVKCGTALTARDQIQVEVVGWQPVNQTTVIKEAKRTGKLRCKECAALRLEYLI